nr:hypothetical protein Iba_chr02bCG11690 [Ipomoea batatas]
MKRLEGCRTLAEGSRINRMLIRRTTCFTWGLFHTRSHLYYKKAIRRAVNALGQNSRPYKNDDISGLGIRLSKSGRESNNPFQITANKYEAVKGINDYRVQKKAVNSRSRYRANYLCSYLTKSSKYLLHVICNALSFMYLIFINLPDNLHAETLLVRNCRMPSSKQNFHRSYQFWKHGFIKVFLTT